ncbi:hypothetical protein Hanom_Chr09g00781731 [Helianthus anomalus]
MYYGRPSTHLVRVKYTWSLAFQKYTDCPCGLHFVTHVPNFFQKYKDGPCGLHFVTHIVPNLDMLKPLDLLAGG